MSENHSFKMAAPLFFRVTAIKIAKCRPQGLLYIFTVILAAGAADDSDSECSEDGFNV